MSYIIVKVYSFECDAPGCQNSADVVPDHRADVRQARSRLPEEYVGWMVCTDGDFCPSHAESRAE